ncbi:uncharacterized protein LOC122257183 [Penaeus japonicus]|uniref:uncharacterized protein LOC122257183 n=1 Tax=Penaeus japonicus TaxID=27405 RepID=UPI001C71607A|nr:uncharacterized protein LOC122257183 [Penaeus japonicus]
MELHHYRSVLATFMVFTLVSFYKVISTEKGSYERPIASYTTNAKIPDVCRSLFTINGVLSKSVLRRFVASKNGVLANESVFPINPGVTPHAGAATYGEEELASAAKEVQQLVHRRASSSGPDTDDYRVLGSLLARLVSFDRHEGEEEAPSEAKEPRPHIRGGSRIAAGGGVLPFVPCVIAPYDQPASFAACVRRRLTKRRSFWMSFLGDSKVRKVFRGLLNRTDEALNYQIRFEPTFDNRTLNFGETLEHFSKLRHRDMIVTSQVAPGLLITMSFRTFSGIPRPSAIEATEEVSQLRRWALGEEQAPQMLVLGYTSWTIQQHRVMENQLAVQERLFEMHRAIVPYLLKLSERARVLVLPQSRVRPHGEAILMKRTDISNANFDWSEKMFLHLLQRHSNKVNTVEKFGNERPRAKFEALRDDHDRTRESHGSFRDHLIPGTSDSGPWWWDSSLPINLAEIDECNELHRRDLAGDLAYTGPPLQCVDQHHMGTGTNNDLVTMLLNLLCNSFLEVEGDFCCK